MSAKKSNGQQGQFLPLAPGRGYFFCNISFEFTLPQVCCKDTQSMARTQLIYPGTEAAKSKYQVNQSWSFIHCRRGLSLWTAWLLVWKYQNAITLVTSRTRVTQNECFYSKPTNTMFSPRGILFWTKLSPEWLYCSSELASGSEITQPTSLQLWRCKPNLVGFCLISWKKQGLTKS